MDHWTHTGSAGWWLWVPGRCEGPYKQLIAAYPQPFAESQNFNNPPKPHFYCSFCENISYFQMSASLAGEGGGEEEESNLINLKR